MDQGVQQGVFSPHIKIFEASTQCLEQFAKYISSDRPQSRRHATVLEERLQIWAKYSGANSRQGLSLDDRLETMSDIKNAILGLLYMILQNLKRVFDLPDEDVLEVDNDHLAVDIQHRPSLPGSSQIGVAEPAEIEEKWNAGQETPWYAVSAAIDMLFEMAIAIRKSSASNTESQIPVNYSRPDDAYFDDIVKLLVRKRFPAARRTLTDQLGRSIFIRRRRILWQQRHEEKISIQRNKSEKNSAKTIADTLPKQLAALQGPTIKKQDQVYSKNKSEEHSIVTPSLTEISRPRDVSVIMRHLRAPTVITGRSRVVASPDEVSPEYPDPPPTSGQKFCICPYCGAPLLASQLTGDNWRNHVDQDLKPFICLSEKCQEPIRFFAARKDWLRHMTEHHGHDWYQKIHMTTWFCDIQHSENIEFANLHSYKEHLADHNISELKKKALMRRNRGVGIRDTGICPLCEATPNRTSVGTGEQTQLSALFDHIVLHLVSIALLSLPAPDVIPKHNPNEDDNNEHGSNRAGAPASSASLSSRSNYPYQTFRGSFPALEGLVDQQKTTMLQKLTEHYQRYQCLSVGVGESKAFFMCTLCSGWFSYNREHWERHERAHYPQHIWACFNTMCATTKDDDLASNDLELVKRCISKSDPLVSTWSDGRNLKALIFIDRDRVREHYQSHHLEITEKTHGDHELDKILFKTDIADSLFPRACGWSTCLQTFDSFDQRLDHIANHLFNGSSTVLWNREYPTCDMCRIHPVFQTASGWPFCCDSCRNELIEMFNEPEHTNVHTAEPSPRLLISLMNLFKDHVRLDGDHLPSEDLLNFWESEALTLKATLAIPSEFVTDLECRLSIPSSSLRLSATDERNLCEWITSYYREHFANNFEVQQILDTYRYVSSFPASLNSFRVEVKEKALDPALIPSESGAKLMKDFKCCGQTLNDLHALLQHHEECHSQKESYSEEVEQQFERQRLEQTKRFVFQGRKKEIERQLERDMRKQQLEQQIKKSRTQEDEQYYEEHDDLYGMLFTN